MSGGFSMMLFGVLVVLGLVLLAVVLVRVLGGGLSGSLRGDKASARRGPEAERSAREVLGERYARGELSTEEYQERLHVLSGGQ